MSRKPVIKWVKNNPEKYNWFMDGSEFLGALRVKNERTGKTAWEYHIVRANCDGENVYWEYQGGESFDGWDFSDFEYFYLLSGEMPSSNEEYE